MRKAVFFLLFLFGIFCAGMLWENIIIQKSDNKNTKEKTSVEKTDYKRSQSDICYKLSDEELGNNGLRKEIKGEYNVYIQGPDGQKSKLFDDSREIVKTGENYCLKVKVLRNNNADEYLKLKVLKELDLKLVLHSVK